MIDYYMLMICYAKIGAILSAMNIVVLYGKNIALVH